MIIIIALFVNVITQILSARLGVNLLKSVLLGFTSGFFIIFPITGPSAPILAEHLITYAAFGYCYFHFVNLGETARRIRILSELKDSAAGLSQNEILIRYNSKEIIDRRISRLMNNGQLLLKDDKFYIAGPVMFFAAKFLSHLKFILLGENIKRI